MGAGIVTGDGGRPAEEWAFRLNILTSVAPDVAAVVSALFAGEQVESREGGVELTTRPGRPPLIILSVRIPDATRVADLHLGGVEQFTLAEHDSRSSIPFPDRWRSTDGGVDRWELFNCRIDYFRWRENATG